MTFQGVDSQTQGIRQGIVKQGLEPEGSRLFGVFRYIGQQPIDQRLMLGVIAGLGERHGPLCFNVCGNPGCQQPGRDQNQGNPEPWP